MGGLFSLGSSSNLEGGRGGVKGAREESYRVIH